jgi:hypothetical protein
MPVALLNFTYMGSKSDAEQTFVPLLAEEFNQWTISH